MGLHCNVQRSIWRNMGVFVALILICQNVSAMRCGNRLVQAGDSQLKVLELCGEPATKHTKTYYQQRTLNRTVSTPLNDLSAPEVQQYNSESTGYDVSEVERIEIDEWVFNFGPNQLIRTVQFHDGVVIDIHKDGGYGF